MSILTPPLSKRGILKALGQDPSKSDVLTVSTNPDGGLEKIMVGDLDVTDQIGGNGGGGDGTAGTGKVSDIERLVGAGKSPVSLCPTRPRRATLSPTFRPSTAVLV